MNQIRVGLIGFGDWAKTAYVPILKSFKEVDIVSECARSDATQAAARKVLGDEFKWYTNYEDLVAYVNDNIIVIKGEVDIIISKDKIEYNKSGNPGMTVGGTGDILAGLIAGITVQGDDMFDSACSAAYLNGRVGDRLYKKFGNQYIASDFINEIPKEINSISE